MPLRELLDNIRNAKVAVAAPQPNLSTPKTSAPSAQLKNPTTKSKQLRDLIVDVQNRVETGNLLPQFQNVNIAKARPKLSRTNNVFNNAGQELKEVSSVIPEVGKGLWNLLTIIPNEVYGKGIKRRY